ncbi:hypothetical protein LFX25_04115 [Leptospira sp. FAT2]|uniref:hypothetical protein n=1 Tax=Leptospira sanjuanensis TaxID=2879643 RepID=UPI001EE968BB|nr:hypothetical protein [Leptospira sanjuanensis]MCG6192422.1 hypothetical protein [Leptospira sanjuanensis]
MSEFDSVQAETSDRELVLTRILDAPRKLVCKVWTTPKHVAQLRARRILRILNVKSILESAENTDPRCVLH